MRLIRLEKKVEIERLHASALSSRVSPRLENVLLRFASSSYKSVREYVKVLSQYRAEDFLVMPVDDMRKLVRSVDKFLPKSAFYKKRKNFVGDEKEFKEINAGICKCFDYEHFLRMGGPWNAGSLAKHINKQLKFCPYCNAETVYAFEVQKSGVKLIKSAFDHFFPRARYPFFGLSLYNLIPACTRCNSALKHDLSADLTEVAHPYATEDAKEDMHDGMRFHIIFNDTKSLSYCDEDYIEQIVLAERKKGAFPKGVAWDNVFKIGDCYTAIYRGDAAEAFRRATEYPKSYCEAKAKELKAAGFTTVGAGLETMLYGASLDKNDINRHRFGKMICDIVETYRK